MRLLLHESRIDELDIEGAAATDTLDSQVTEQAEAVGFLDDQDNSFYVDQSIKVDTVLAGPFSNVKIYMTERVSATRGFRWTDTQLVGTLKLTVQNEVSGIPLASIKVLS